MGHCRESVLGIGSGSQGLEIRPWCTAPSGALSCKAVALLGDRDRTVVLCNRG